MKCPENATHLRLQGAYVLIDFSKNTGIIEATNKIELPINNEFHDVDLSPLKLPKGKEAKYFFYELNFYRKRVMICMNFITGNLMGWRF
jgi:hypothetical protein